MQIDSKHVPNLVIANRMCLQCLNNEKCENTCGYHEFDSNDEFCEWLFDKNQQHFTAIAHNMKNYDGFFIMNYLVQNLLPTEKPPQCVLSGCKLLVITHANVRVIDSYNFIPMALSKLPKTFGLKELKKGYFPHFFNTPLNQNYVGPYPAKEFYGFETMSVSDNAAFQSWYEQQRDKTFDFNQELRDYCKSDVDILTKACLTFRELFIKITHKDGKGVDPLQISLTIAAACHYVYRRNFMPKDSIALIPDFGYENHEASSHKAILWLKYISKCNNVYIQHARNIGEKRIGDYKLDGWDDKNKIAYEFHGCLFHGFPKCYTSNTYNAVKHELMSKTHERHLKRMEKLNQSSEIYAVTEIWECQYDYALKFDENFKRFVENEQTIRPPLCPRNALAGGRTNAFVLHYVGKAGYVDFTSLYPNIQKYGVFPIGHPEIYTENFATDVSKYFGLIYCKVIPPTNLYIPVLPYHLNGKLLFPLCGACALEKLQRCDHSDEERALEGTWVSLELNEALKRGYRIIRIYEIWHWNQVEQYDPVTKTGGLFTDYFNTFLTIKVEASGYPHWVKTEEDKQKYIDDYYKHEGIKLNKDNIEVNPGLKALSKLLLNSQWGRYAMKTHRTQSKFITNLKELYSWFDNAQYEIQDLTFPTDTVCMLYYKDAKEMHWGNNQTNVVIAAFVTAQARLKLFFELEKLVFCIPIQTR